MWAWVIVGCIWSFIIGGTLLVVWDTRQRKSATQRDVRKALNLASMKATTIIRMAEARMEAVAKRRRQRREGSWTDW